MTFKIKTQIKLWIWRIVTPLLMNHQSPVYFRNCVSGVWGSPNGINDPVWEGKKTKHQNRSCFSQHTVQNLSLSASSNSLWPKKKQKTKGVIRFTFLDSLLYLWNDQFGARRTEPETYFFAQPSWSNMIFLQHLTLTWQSLSVCVEKCESCSCENTWEVMCVRCYDSPSWNLCKIFFVDFTLKVKMLKPQNVSNLCKKKKKFVEFRADLLKTPTGVKRLEYALLLIQPFKEMESARRRSSMWGF